ncbi:glycoprotein-N-acetylgalactosamine 3-beta-galactosyltransferase 1 [Cherax quadricarinatus]
MKKCEDCGVEEMDCRDKREATHTRGILALSRIFRRRPRHSILLLLVSCLIIILIHQLFLVICTYQEYLLALLPEGPLPAQHRQENRSNSSSVRSQDGRKSGNQYGKAGFPRILCLITTSPGHHQERAIHVAATWATHCTRAIFLTSSPDPVLPHTLVTSGAASYDQLWDKVTQGFEWAYKQRQEFDFVIKTDDDTFLLVENLQAALLHLHPDQPLATGLHLRTWDTGSTYLNGGAGYTLSRGAVRRLVEEGLRDEQCFKNLQLGTNEDVNMAMCLTFVGVELLDSRDSAGRQRFHMYPPQQVVDPRQENSVFHLWLKKISVFPYKFGYSELSDEVISFHYVDGQTMYLLYYLIYVVNPTSSLTHRPPNSKYQSNLKPISPLQKSP